MWFSTQPGGLQAAGQPSEPRFRTTTELVEVLVAVLDSEGRPVEDLTVSDFVVREEGQQKKIEVFEHFGPPARSEREQRFRASEFDVASNDASERRRAFLIVFDDVHIEARNTSRARRAVEEFVTHYLDESDLIAIMATTGQPGYSQEFTTDRVRALEVLAQLVGQKQPHGSFLDPVLDIRATTTVLARAAEVLSRESRSLTAILLVSQGTDYNIYDGTDPQAADVVRAMENAILSLRRSGIVLYALDPRGLVSVEGDDLENMPAMSGSDATFVHPIVERSRKAQTAVTAPNATERLRLSLESLTHIAESTGGFAVVNSNDYRKGLARIDDETGSSYVLGYYAEPTRREEYRSIDVTVRRPGVRVVARRGYFARPIDEGKEWDAVPGNVPRRVQAALEGIFPISDLSLRVQAVPLSGPNRSDVQFVVEVGGGKLQWKEDRGEAAEDVTFALTVSRSDGKVAERKTTTLNFRVAQARLEGVKLTGVRWLTALSLKEGRYHIRLAGYAAREGRVGSVFFDVDVPSSKKAGLSPILLTSATSVLAATGVEQSHVAPFPTPPITVRKVVEGDVVHVATEVARNLGKMSDGLIFRVSKGTNGDVVLDRRVPVLEVGGRRWSIVGIDTAQLTPGRFLLQFEAPLKQWPYRDGLIVGTELEITER